jgi:hypothetical protein
VPNLIVLSPCFYEDAEPAKLMVNSATINHLTVQLYGIGQQFIPHGADAQIKELAFLMSAEKVADYVLVTDCRDVLFQAGETEIMDKFNSYKQALVMSAERGCWPPDPEIERLYGGRDPNGYDYVNAGQYIGEWYYVRACLRHLLNEYRGKDGADNSQGWWPHARLRGELDFALDSRCEIFQTMSGGASGHVFTIDKRVMNECTHTFPCSIHFNGNPGVKNPQLEMYRRLF